jgi:chloramphenicol 3-O phosphotransferase
VFSGVVILNGASSAGKTSIVRELQRVMPDTWIADGIDVLLELLPPALRDNEAGLKFTADRTFTVGPELRRVERAWMRSIATIARDGVNVFIDDVFLGGFSSQQRWRDALGTVPHRFVAVRCERSVLLEREQARADRHIGSAADQIERVHDGVEYDFEVDTTSTSTEECAAAIAAYLASISAQ